MINRFIVFLNFFLFFSFGIFAQSSISVENNLLYTNAIVFCDGTQHNVKSLIDTGASVCLIDSTYAVDSCNIVLNESNLRLGNTAGKYIKSFILISTLYNSLS